MPNVSLHMFIYTDVCTQMHCAWTLTGAHTHRLPPLIGMARWRELGLGLCLSTNSYPPNKLRGLIVNQKLRDLQGSVCLLS